MKQAIIFEKIYLDKAVENTSLARNLLQKLKSVPLQKVSDSKNFLKEIHGTSPREGKKILWITSFKGGLVKACPGTGKEYLCCQYWTINAQTGCPLECTYCILQNYLNKPFITVYTNADDIPKEIDTLIEKEPNRLFRIGTGELTDSLALDPLTYLNKDLVLYALSKKNLIVEIKTKTDLIQHLPQTLKRNILISWSLNPEEIIQTEEYKTASLEARLKAARKALDKGYRIGFHFDPILMLPGWENLYKNLIDNLQAAVPQEDIMWISMGSLRYPPELKKSIDERFPKTRITQGELVRGRDGKMRYFRPLRTEMYKKIYGWFREKWKDVFIYFCMENEPVWLDVMGFSPDDNNHLDYLFHESLYRRFPDLELPHPSRKNYQ